MKPSRACLSLRSSLAAYRQEQEAKNAVVLPEKTDESTVKPRHACGSPRLAREASQHRVAESAEPRPPPRKLTWAIRCTRACQRPRLWMPLLLLAVLLVLLPFGLAMLPERRPSERRAPAAASPLPSAELLPPPSPPAAASRPPRLRPDASLNLLLLLVDDLRAAVGAYGDSLALTPNIDTLASQGVLFTRAYASVATCSPSRTSLLTGMRPDRHKVYDLETHFRQTVPAAVTLPQLFREKGYLSLSFGKVFHEGLDDAASWTPQEELTRAGLGELASSRGTSQTYGDDWAYMEYDSEAAATPYRGRKFGRSWERAERRRGYVDAKTADKACLALEWLRGAARPFFLAVGLVRPHLPWSAPEWAWAQHDEKDFKLPVPLPPTDASELTLQSLNRWGELRAYSGAPARGSLIGEKALKHVQGYYAAVTFADHQVGRVLTRLDKTALSNSTAVVLTSDHGWKLGEFGSWSKHTTLEADLRVPLVVRHPRAPRRVRGARTDAIVELIDLYPTIAQWSGLPPPAGQLDGVPFTALLTAPRFKEGENAEFFAPDRYAVSQWPLSTHQPGGADVFPCMGYRIRTVRHAVTRWYAANASVDRAVRCSESVDVFELAVPGAREQENVAERFEGMRVLARLAPVFERQFQWAPSPSSISEPIKRHYQLWISDGEADGEFQTRVALDCNKRRCSVAQRVEKLHAEGYRGDFVSKHITEEGVHEQVL
ncbi:hypothetical protein AB1Y20_010131 [Prymnesium parvum]|uniref:Sulfatase N-terminal domain-containing protein n=1 Tax=Prymnesium parvum TaxID=97485 RepID=A0AB34K6C5_PRYPA